MQADASDWGKFIRQLGNIKSKAVLGASYNSYTMANPKVGDDLFDAASAGVWALLTRGVASYVPTVIGHRTATREQLMGMS